VLLAQLAVVFGVVIDGDTTCPTPEQVTAALETMLSSADPGGDPHRAHLIASSDRVDIELHSSVGRLLAQRTVTRDGSCDELASAIAVVIATWEAELAGTAPELHVAATTNATTDRAGAADVRTRTTTTRAATELIAGGGVLMTADRDGLGFGGLGELAIARANRRVALRFAAIASSPRHERLATGAIAWHRQSLALGARVRLVGAHAIRVDGVADVALGLLTARGEGFTENRAAYSFDPGVGGGARLVVPLGSLDLFAEATETWWLRGGTLQVTGVVDEIKQLPRHEQHVVVGLVGRLKDF
jgi:hypothetical protein